MTNCFLFFFPPPKKKLGLECAEDEAGSKVSFCFQHGLILDFVVHTILGDVNQIKDLPRLTTIITSKLRSIIENNLVAPHKKSFYLPGLTKTK